MLRSAFAVLIPAQLVGAVVSMIAVTYPGRVVPVGGIAEVPSMCSNVSSSFSAKCFLIVLPEKRGNTSTVASGLLASEAVGVGVRSPVMSGPLKSLDKRMSFTTHRARQIGHVGPSLGPVSIHSSMQLWWKWCLQRRIAIRERSLYAMWHMLHSIPLAEMGGSGGHVSSRGPTSVTCDASRSKAYRVLRNLHGVVRD